jgi:hypothetical protein
MKKSYHSKIVPSDEAAMTSLTSLGLNSPIRSPAIVATPNPPLVLRTV